MEALLHTQHPSCTSLVSVNIINDIKCLLKYDIYKGNKNSIKTNWDGLRPGLGGLVFQRFLSWEQWVVFMGLEGSLALEFYTSQKPSLQQHQLFSAHVWIHKLAAIKKGKQNQTTAEGTIKRNMQLTASKVWIWGGCRPIRWLWLNLMVITWSEAAELMAVRCGICHFLSLCMCADGCGRAAISRQKPYSLSVLQCIERTGLANSCKSFRVPPPRELRARVLQLAPRPISVTWICE